MNHWVCTLWTTWPRCCLPVVDVTAGSARTHKSAQVKFTRIGDMWRCWDENGPNYRTGNGLKKHMSQCPGKYSTPAMTCLNRTSFSWYWGRHSHCHSWLWLKWTRPLSTVRGYFACVRWFQQRSITARLCTFQQRFNPSVVTCLLSVLLSTGPWVRT